MVSICMFLFTTFTETQPIFYFLDVVEITQQKLTLETLVVVLVS